MKRVRHRRRERGRRPRAAGWAAACCALLAATALGCATLSADIAGTGGAEDLGREIRPDAPPEFDMLVAQQHESQGRLNEAIAAYRRALAKDPDSAFLHRKLADSLVRQGSPAEALEHAVATRALGVRVPLLRAPLGARRGELARQQLLSLVRGPETALRSILEAPPLALWGGADVRTLIAKLEVC